VKVFLKSFNYWRSNSGSKKIWHIEQKFKSPGRNSFNSTTVTGDLNATTLKRTYDMAEPC
jgi:hypothetical protein